MPVSHILRASLIVSLSMITILGCDTEKVIEGKTKTEYVTHPPLQITKDTPLKYKRYQKVDLYDIVQAKRGQASFELLSGNADLGYGGQIEFRETGVVVVRATLRDGGTTVLTFTVDEALRFKRSSENDYLYFPSRRLRIASRTEIQIEGGTPPYKFALKSADSNPPLSTIDDQGVLRTSYTEEKIYVTVTDADGTTIKSEAIQVSKYLQDFLEYDGVWGTDGSIPGASKSLKDWAVTADQKSFVTLHYLYDRENYIQGATVTKYNLDGKLDSKFGQNGSFKFADKKTELRPQQILIQKNGGILVVAYTQPEVAFGYVSEEEKKEAFRKRDIVLYRLTSSGQLDPHFKTVSLRKLVGTEKAQAYDFDMRAITSGDSIILVSSDNNKQTVMKLKSDGSLDSLFGDKGTTSGLQLSREVVLAVDETRVYVAGMKIHERSENADLYDTKSEIALAAFDLESGKLDESFGAQGIVTVDPRHRPATNLPYNSPKAILIQDGKIHVAGVAWQSHVLLQFNLSGKLLDTAVNQRSFNEFSYLDLSLVSLKNKIIVLSSRMRHDLNPSWILEVSDNRGLSDFNTGTLIPDQTFKDRYGYDLTWWKDNSARILKLPDGACLITVHSGIARLIPN